MSILFDWLELCKESVLQCAFALAFQRRKHAAFCGVDVPMLDDLRVRADAWLHAGPLAAECLKACFVDDYRPTIGNSGDTGIKLQAPGQIH